MNQKSHARLSQTHGDGAARIQLITIEYPGGFSFAGSLHGRLDCPRICPSEIPEFLQLLQNIIRSPPLSIVEYDKAVHSNAFGTKVQNMNLAIKVHPVPEGKDGLGSMWQRFDLKITEVIISMKINRKTIAPPFQRF